jgi:FtsP/CotA-like multicopper oxidase with cupredoxin domain
MPPRRRGLVATLAIVLASAVLLVVALGGAGIAFAWRQASVDTVGTVDFDHRLAVPLAESTTDAHGRRVFDLTAHAGHTDLGGENPSPTWGFNGSYLGPTLRAHRGEQVLVKVHNDLPVATTVHWHGMHLPARFDGGPHQLVAPGATWEPTWRVDQPAATLWYHPHPHGETADHVSRGLAGMFILDDEESDRLPLPHTYGVDDLPVIVQDKDVRGDGHLGAGAGRTIVVNGTPGPYAAVSTERVRLRLLNASTMRVFDFRLDNGAPFELVATDGGLLPRKASLDHVRLAPGERAEVVVTMQPGERRVLRSVDPDLGSNFLSAHFDGGDARFDVLQLRAADTLRPSPAVPEVLSTTNLAAAGTESESVRTRGFTLSGHSINGRQMVMDRVDFVPTVDTTETWDVLNTEDDAHSFHVHDVQFRVLSVDGRQPPPQLSGLKDTIYLEPHRHYRLLLRFADYADPDSVYMVHCHMLEHEDHGMMLQFAVVKPGDHPGELAAVPATRHTTHVH